MGIKRIAAKSAIVLLGITALAAPTAAWANQPPPGGGGGAAECYPYVTSISKSGNTLRWTVKVYSCSEDGNFLIENDQWDATHESGPSEGPDSTCGYSACTHSFSRSISGHASDRFCAESDVESTIPKLGTLLSGGELCT